MTRVTREAPSSKQQVAFTGTVNLTEYLLAEQLFFKINNMHRNQSILYEILAANKSPYIHHYAVFHVYNMQRPI